MLALGFCCLALASIASTEEDLHRRNEKARRLQTNWNLIYIHGLREEANPPYDRLNRRAGIDPPNGDFDSPVPAWRHENWELFQRLAAERAAIEEAERERQRTRLQALAAPTPRPPVAAPRPTQAPVASGGTNGHLQRIKQCESGGHGGYTAHTGNGFSGAYQFTQSTWNSVVGKAGYPEYIGVPAASAPPHVQDAAAQYLYDTGGPGHWPVCQYR